jgi:acetyl esterase/lipase
MLDDRTSRTGAGGDVVWPHEANRFGWDCYLRGLTGDDGIPAYAAPGRADDLTGLPPAGIFVGSADIFCAEDIAFASRLLAAQVPTELHVYDGAPHGFDHIAPSTEVARRCRRDMAEFLSRLMGCNSERSAVLD